MQLATSPTQMRRYVRLGCWGRRVRRTKALSDRAEASKAGHLFLDSNLSQACPVRCGDLFARLGRFHMATNDALLQAILDNPEDDAVRLIYADWLEEQGESVRAEFMPREPAAELGWTSACSRGLRPACFCLR
jgi:uncharacterized protein (TIGR02996 family)